MKKFFQEFKQFINRGNVLDMAVGVIIGAAFKDIVTSLVNDIISPIIGLVFKADFKDLKWVLREAEVHGEEIINPELSINYGSFITGVINFIILAFVVFLIVKLVTKITSLGKKKTEEEPAPPTTRQCPYCLSEIPLEATRCAHCTSEVPPVEEEQAEQ